jgi:hypothetical protein
LRLSDLGWWMRVLCQYIAVRANREDHELGKFWQSRFRAVRLLDEAALLACAAYVDLNPIRGGNGTGSVRGACPISATNRVISPQSSADFSRYYQQMTTPAPLRQEPFRRTRNLQAIQSPRSYPRQLALKRFLRLFLRLS